MVERGGDGSVVVVGGGILGCSIAVHLVDRGVRPVLIDPERPGQGTSTGSFASVSALGKDPVAWFQLACAGVSGWTRFAERLGGGVGLRRGGEVRWASDPEAGRRLARLLHGRARVQLDDDGVRVEVGTEVLRPRTALRRWPPGPKRSRWPPRSAWRSRPCPAPACWSRPGRCRRSPTGSSTCREVQDRRCTCASGPTGRC